MADLNKQALEMWNSMKPMIDREIEQQTKGTVQRRKAKVTTAPSLITQKIGVTEPFGDQYFIPFNTNLSTAKVGDVVWVEFMYGATNAFASMYASADSKDVTVGGVLDVVQRRCSATLSSAGWYRAIKIPSAYGSVRIRIQREWDGTAPEVHNIELLICYKNGSYSATWCNEESSSYDSSSVVIDKIRCTRSTLFDGFYVDIHYSTSASNVPVITFDASTTKAYGNNVTAESLQSVADAPSGETVLTTHIFQDSTPNRRTYIGVLQANSSISVAFSTLATAKAARGSNSVTCVDAIADEWGGVSYSSRMDTLATVTSSGNVVTITNQTWGVMNYIIETY